MYAEKFKQYNEELFIEICDRYGANWVEGSGMPMLKKDGVPEEITNDDIENLFPCPFISFGYSAGSNEISNVDTIKIQLSDLPYAC